MKMFQEISYYMIFGKPLIMYMGLLTLALFIIAAAVGYLVFTGKTNMIVRTHKRLATIAIAVALIHGFFGVALFF
jgi:hypothetical protein